MPAAGRGTRRPRRRRAPEPAITTDELHYRYESKLGFMASVAETTISVVGSGRPVGRAHRSSGFGSIEISLDLFDEGSPVAVLRKGFMSTGFWEVLGPDMQPLAQVRHRLLSWDWQFATPDGRTMGEGHVGGMRPRGELFWDHSHLAWLERRSMFATGLFSSRRVWDLRMHVLGDPVARLVALTLPLALDHRERESERSG